MRVYANAKVNLTLDVVKKRKDGYHEMDMIMVPLSLCDVLDVTLAAEDEVICESAQIPLDESNTIYRAIALMRERYGVTEHFHVELEKHIPMQAGLAGGSADGAAMLKAIVSICNLHISQEELLAVAKEIGADVPFCVINKASRVQGIGEMVQPFALSCPFHLLLVKPEEGVSTKKAFSLIDFDTCVHPDVDAAMLALQENDYERFCQVLGNTLEASACLVAPCIQEIKASLSKWEGVDAVLMSGSGSTVFAISRNQQVLQDIEKQYREKYAFVACCEIR